MPGKQQFTSWSFTGDDLLLRLCTLPSDEEQREPLGLEATVAALRTIRQLEEQLLDTPLTVSQRKLIGKMRHARLQVWATLNVTDHILEAARAY